MSLLLSLLAGCAPEPLSAGSWKLSLEVSEHVFATAEHDIHVALEGDIVLTLQPDGQALMCSSLDTYESHHRSPLAPGGASEFRQSRPEQVALAGHWEEGRVVVDEPTDECGWPGLPVPPVTLECASIEVPVAGVRCAVTGGLHLHGLYLAEEGEVRASPPSQWLILAPGAGAALRLDWQGRKWSP